MRSNFVYRDYVNKLVEENGTDVRKVKFIGCKMNNYGSVDVDLAEIRPTRNEKMSAYNLIHTTIDKETAPKVVIPAFEEVEVEFAKAPLGSDKVWINKFIGLEKFEKEGD